MTHLSCIMNYTTPITMSVTGNGIIHNATLMTESFKLHYELYHANYYACHMA